MAQRAPNVLDLRVRVPDFRGAEKGVCAGCGKRRLLFCGECVLPVSGGPGVPPLPGVRLPLKLHVLRGKEERAGKSTATHAALLAPRDCAIYCVPDEVPT